MPHNYRQLTDVNAASAPLFPDFPPARLKACNIMGFSSYDMLSNHKDAALDSIRGRQRENKDGRFRGVLVNFPASQEEC